MEKPNTYYEVSYTDKRNGGQSERFETYEEALKYTKELVKWLREEGAYGKYEYPQISRYDYDLGKEYTISVTNPLQNRRTLITSNQNDMDKEVKRLNKKGLNVEVSEVDKYVSKEKVLAYGDETMQYENGGEINAFNYSIGGL